jgi:hypothetical protein
VPWGRSVLADLGAFVGEVKQDRAAVVRVGASANKPGLLERVDLGRDSPWDDAQDGGDVAHAELTGALNVADGLPHVYHNALCTPEARAAIAQLAEFTRAISPR